MSDADHVKNLLASLSEQLNEDRLAEMRGVGDVSYLPPGALTELLKDQPCSVEDIVTALLSGWNLRSREAEHSAARIAELEDLCQKQQKAIDLIADHATRLRFLLKSLSPEADPISPIDLLRQIAAGAAPGDRPAS